MRRDRPLTIEGVEPPAPLEPVAAEPVDTETTQASADDPSAEAAIAAVPSAASSTSAFVAPSSRPSTVSRARILKK